jgi:DNA-binding MarR family transcriptional regulator
MSSKENMDRALEEFDRLTKILASLESFAGSMGLSKLELVALDLISKEGEVIMMSRLAKGLGIGLSTATGISDRLVEKHLVERKRNHGDRRVVRIALTDKGKNIVLAHQKQKRQIVAKIMGALTPQEQKNFLLIVEKIVRTMEGGK